MSREGTPVEQEPTPAFDDPEGLVNIFRSEELKRAEWTREHIKDLFEVQKKLVKKIAERDEYKADNREYTQGLTGGGVKLAIDGLEKEIQELNDEFLELRNKI